MEKLGQGWEGRRFGSQRGAGFQAGSFSPRRAGHQGLSPLSPPVQPGKLPLMAFHLCLPSWRMRGGHGSDRVAGSAPRTQRLERFSQVLYNKKKKR